MDFKEILKPSLWKVVLSVVIFFVGIHLFPCSFAGGVPPGPYTSGWTTCGLLVLFYGLGGSVTDGGYYFAGVLSLSQYGTAVLVGSLVLSYLVSCIIIYLHRL